ncbi:MAG: ATP-binding cassette domain-containing protein [Planctomycetaceae bacterium]|nr:ATP-binding cassette domain-containing protein [Planctomycetaceae bacterium]
MMTATIEEKSDHNAADGSDQTVRASGLRVENVSKRFGKTPVLTDVSLQVAKGEFVCILGPSGCGKTTLLRIIAGLEMPDTGHVVIGGEDMTRVPTAGRGIGIVFQSYALFPNLTALQNVKFGVRRNDLGSSYAERKALALLDTVSLADSAGKYPAQLSGGQQQRVALARALAPEPSIQLLDEPLSALDAKVRLSLRKEIRRVQRQFGITAIMVTHDQEEALTMSDRVVIMHKGLLAQFASPEEIYRLPSTQFVADFIGAMNFLPGWRVDGDKARFGGLTLRLPKALEADCLKATLAIRPEDVQVTRDSFPGENTIIATVADMEFRGTGYCIGLTVFSNDGTGSIRMEALIPPLRVSQLGIQGGDTVKVRLPSDRLVSFVEDAQSGASGSGVRS